MATKSPLNAMLGPLSQERRPFSVYVVAESMGLWQLVDLDLHDLEQAA